MPILFRDAPIALPFLPGPAQWTQESKYEVCPAKENPEIAEVNESIYFDSWVKKIFYARLCNCLTNFYCYTSHYLNGFSACNFFQLIYLFLRNARLK